MEPGKTCLYYEQMLHGALGLPTIANASERTPTEYSDILFIYIDFENGKQIKSRVTENGCIGKIQAQAGVSIFDTRTLINSALPSSSQETPLPVGLKTYNIGLGGSPSTKKLVDRRFLFGETKWIQLADLSASIDKLVDRTRNIVLVGHGFAADLHVLKALGFDLETSIIGILDTEAEARAVFGPPDERGGLRLGRVLARLKCSVGGCHVAGNDANFILCALLLLAAEAYSGSEDSLDESARERLEIIKAIGLRGEVTTGVVIFPGPGLNKGTGMATME
ncbi:hypothetical protein LARI1_G009457 [Lachnellula arida]|uniref:Gfd2/YDR514C-like C-terminal domain-containing protein n=1 Tax=Lachnellula arida TaxID=1316785 RepID=A0A8T9AYS9_9HELO|nr:hypothetical protein LARI1_G009457 [Lachnellula arida]